MSQEPIHMGKPTKPTFPVELSDMPSWTSTRHTPGYFVLRTDEHGYLIDRRIAMVVLCVK